MMEIKLKLPQYLSKKETERILRVLYAIELFQRGVVSVGRAVEIAGIPYQDFLEELRKRGIHAYSYDDDELLEELLS